MRPSVLLNAALIVSLALAGSAWAQQMYRWVDKNGRVTYSDTPPPPDARKAEEKRLQHSVLQTSGMSYAMKQAVQNSPVTLYLGSDCPPACDSARHLLRKRGIPATEKVLAKQEDVDAYNKLFGTREPLVPSLVVGKTTLKGYQEAAWNRALSDAGYPTSDAPPPPPVVKGKAVPPPAPVSETPAALPDNEPPPPTEN
jgi:hypothetical protein